MPINIISIQIDYQLKWDKHIDCIEKNKQIFVKKFCKLIQTKSLLPVYYALFYGIDNYDNIMIIICLGKDVLQNLQKKLLK